MTGRPNSLLGEIASQAAIERTTFLIDAPRPDPPPRLPAARSACG